MDSQVKESFDGNGVFVGNGNTVIDANGVVVASSNAVAAFCLRHSS